MPSEPAPEGAQPGAVPQLWDLALDAQDPLESGFESEEDLEGLQEDDLVHSHDRAVPQSKKDQYVGWHLGWTVHWLRNLTGSEVTDAAKNTEMRPHHPGWLLR